MSTRRREMRNSTHSSILSAARQTFQRLGFESTTIKTIAQAADVAVGTVMSHCGTKEQLLYEVFHRDIDAITDQVFADLPAARLDKQLEYVASSFLHRYAADATLYTAFLERSLLARGEWGNRFAEQTAAVGKRVGELFGPAIARGEIPAGVDVRATVTNFFAIYYFVLITQIKERFVDIESGVEQLSWQIDHLYQGILACAKSN